MANRQFQQFQYTIEKGVVTLFANIAIGATGAPTLNVVKSKGIASVVRNSAGKYTINFQDGYQYLMFMDSCIVLASGAPSSSTSLQMVVRADNSSAASPNLVVEFLNSSGVAADLASGSILLLSPQLKNSVI